jgi:drug/metabolite transporter (DMT)-like permease
VGSGVVAGVGELRGGGDAAGMEVMPSRTPLQFVALAAAFAAVYVIWGSTYLAIAIGLESIPPLMLMGVRSVIAGALLYGFARARGAPPADAASWRNAALIGVLFFVIGHGLLSWGETRVPSGAAAVLIATEPLFIVALAWRGGRLAGRSKSGQRPGAAVIAALVLGIAGVALMTLPGSGGGLDPLGAVALVIASLSWAVGTFHVASTGSPVRAAGLQLFIGGTILLLLSSLTGEVNAVDTAAVSTRSVYALSYLIVFGSVITYAAYIWLLREIGAARVASHTFVNPVIAVALGVWLGEEAFGARTVAASLLVLVAVVLLVRGRAADGKAPGKSTSRVWRWTTRRVAMAAANGGYDDPVGRSERKLRD